MAHRPLYSDAELVSALAAQIKETEESHRRRRSAGTITLGESAGILERLRAGKARLEQLARLTPLQQQFLGLVFCIDPAAAAPVVEPVAPAKASGSQWEAITKLLNHPCFTRPEKTKGLLRANDLTPEAAAAFIEELQARVDAADTPPAAPTPPPAPAPAPEALSTHPALGETAMEQARAAYRAALAHPLIQEDERERALAVLDDWTETELRTKAAAVRVECTHRETLTPQAQAA